MLKRVNGTGKPMNKEMKKLIISLARYIYQTKTNLVIKKTILMSHESVFTRVYLKNFR